MVQVVYGKDKLALLLLHPKIFMDMDAAKDKDGLNQTNVEQNNCCLQLLWTQAFGWVGSKGQYICYLWTGFFSFLSCNLWKLMILQSPQVGHTGQIPGLRIHSDKGKSKEQKPPACIRNGSWCSGNALLVCFGLGVGWATPSQMVCNWRKVQGEEQCDK